MALGGGRPSLSSSVACRRRLVERVVLSLVDEIRTSSRRHTLGPAHSWTQAGSIVGLGWVAGQSKFLVRVANCYVDAVSFVCRQSRVPINREIGNAAWTKINVCLTCSLNERNDA